MRGFNNSSPRQIGAGAREAVRQAHIRAAKQARKDVEAVQGHLPTMTVVDGRRGAREEEVNDRGVIVYLFDATRRAAVYTLQVLRERAPVDRRPQADDNVFRDSFVVLVDGVESDMEDLPPGQEVVIVSRLPYSRRLEHGWSLQAPDGVFEVVGRSVARQWPMIDVKFSYVALEGANFSSGRSARYPALFLSSKVI